MKLLSGGAHQLTLLIILLCLVALVSCFAASNAQKNSGSGHNNKGFGKKASNDDPTNGAPSTAPTANAAGLEQRFLEPYSLKLTTDNEDEDDGGGGVAAAAAADDDNNLAHRSVRTLTDRSAGDILLEIPLEDTLTVDRIRSRLSSSCVRDGDGDEPNNEDEEEALALGLLRLRNQASDPYVSNVLPKKHSNVWTLPQDLWKKVSTVLPRCYAETFDATRQRVHKFAMQVEQTSTATTDTLTLDDALWAFSMVRSRSLAVPELDTSDKKSPEDRMPLALIPGLDLLNHAFGSRTQLQLDIDNNHNNGEESKSKWVVTSLDTLKAGDEVTLSYGDDKDNWKLLLTYGFAIANNPNAVVFWSWRDLLDAAHVVRPDTFTDPVCQQLMRHPQLEAYTMVSEQRATFSYDVQANAPRESLTNGLIMLNSLATQLGKAETESDALGNEVLAELRRRRLEELRDGQSRLNEYQQEHEEIVSEWKPFLWSLRVALKSEEQQLQALQNN